MADKVHRLFPQSAEAEKGVLCSFLLNPREVGGFCQDKGITDAHFQSTHHGEIFAALMQLWEAGGPIDFIVLTEFLHSKGRLEQVGGAAFVTELFTLLPTAANVAHYVEIVRNKHTLREIIRVGTEFAARAYDERENADNLLDDMEAAALGIAEGRTSGAADDSPKAHVLAAVDRLDEMFIAKGQPTGLRTGFTRLDYMTNGLNPGELTILAARPSVGKSALGVQVAMHAAKGAVPVGIFTLEMTGSALMQRQLLADSQITLSQIRSNSVSAEEMQRVQSSALALCRLPLRIDAREGLTVMQLRAAARRWHRKHGTRLIVVDYIQLMRGTKNFGDKRHLEIAEISGGLKSLAKELGIPVLALAQLNRELDKGKTPREPRASDLRESGSLEQDADNIWLLHRPPSTGSEGGHLSNETKLIVAKCRNGPTGDIPLHFNPESTSFLAIANPHA